MRSRSLFQTLKSNEIGVLLAGVLVAKSMNDLRDCYAGAAVHQRRYFIPGFLACRFDMHLHGGLQDKIDLDIAVRDQDVFEIGFFLHVAPWVRDKPI